jgi:hypothetical protein
MNPVRNVRFTKIVDFCFVPLKNKRTKYEQLTKLMSRLFCVFVPLCLKFRLFGGVSRIEVYFVETLTDRMLQSKIDEALMTKFTVFDTQGDDSNCLGSFV